MYGSRFSSTGQHCFTGHGALLRPGFQLFSFYIEISINSYYFHKEKQTHWHLSFYLALPSRADRVGNKRRKGGNDPDAERSALKQTSPLPTWAARGRNQWHN